MRTRRIPRIGVLTLTILSLSAPLADAASTKDVASVRAAAGVSAKSDGWPETREGALGRKWVAAFAEGEAGMRRFYAEDLAESARAERSVEARLARYRELREKFGKLTFGSVTRQSAGELTVILLDADAASHTFIFKAQTRAPFRLLSVSMTQLQRGGHGGGFHH